MRLKPRYRYGVIKRLHALHQMEGYPYAYCANNPIRNIDLRGDSITVLNLGTGTDQHMGMLIQNDAGKWQYFSVNGDNKYLSGSHTGGREYNDLAVGEWDSPQHFMDSNYNRNGDKETNSYGYTEGYVIPTTQEQDETMRETFTSISENESYHLLGNNCSTVVQRSMEAAGLETYKQKTMTYRVPANHLLGESSFTTTYTTARPIVPSNSYKSIIRLNPQGQPIKRR